MKETRLLMGMPITIEVVDRHVTQDDLNKVFAYFVWVDRDPEQKLVFIAGGIGITPFRSMLKYLLDIQERRDIVLLYANKTANEIVYQDVLNAAQAKLGVNTFYTLTDPVAAPKNWSGFLGRINEEMIQKAVPDYQERTYYVSGPPHMVNAYEQILKHMQIKQKQIKKDFFPGLV